MPLKLARRLAAVLSLVALSGLAATPGLASPVQDDPMLSERAKRISSSALSKWSSVLGRVWAQQPIADRACSRRLGGDCGLVRWRGFIEDLMSEAAGEQLQEVHAFVNRTRYREDWRVWGKRDYWAAPGEFFARGGDCEDFAIAKYLSLKALGFDTADMRVLVLKDQRRDVLHAVLLVQHRGETLVLDNLSRRVMTWDEVPHYLPLYSVNETDFWLHRNGTTMG